MSANPADLMPLAGVYGQMGYRVHLVSATTGLGTELWTSDGTAAGTGLGRFRA